MNTFRLCWHFRVHGSGRRVQGSGFRVQGSGFRVQGSGVRSQGSGFRVQGSGFRSQESGFRVQGTSVLDGMFLVATTCQFEVAGSMFRVSGLHGILLPVI